jgi:hypothetical protein
MARDDVELERTYLAALEVATDLLELVDQLKQLRQPTVENPTDDQPTIAELLDRKSLVADPRVWVHDELEALYSFRGRADRHRQPPRPDFGGAR